MYFNTLYLIIGLEMCVLAWEGLYCSFNSGTNINKDQMKVCQVLYIGSIQYNSRIIRWCDLAEFLYAQAFVTYKVLSVQYPVHLPWISFSLFDLQEVLNFTIKGILAPAPNIRLLTVPSRQTICSFSLTLLIFLGSWTLKENLMTKRDSVHASPWLTQNLLGIH